MRFLPVLLSASLLAGQDKVQNPSSSPRDVAAGARTFRSHCSPCHGLNGEGGRGPNLASGVFFRGSSDLDLLNNISNGIPQTEMPSLFYTEDRVWQVVAYIRSLSAADRPAGDARRGAWLYQNKGCPQCHNVGGSGGRLGPDLTEIGRRRSPQHLLRSILEPGADVPQNYWLVRFTDDSGRKHEGFLMNEDTYTVQLLELNEKLGSYAKPGLQGYSVDRTSKMPSYNDSLTAAEAGDLVAYIAGLRPPGGVR